MIARDGDPIIIADSEVPKNDLANRSHILRVPKTVDCIQNILTVIPLQLLSYHIAELNGLNVSYSFFFFDLFPSLMIIIIIEYNRQVIRIINTLSILY